MGRVSLHPFRSSCPVPDSVILTLTNLPIPDQTHHDKRKEKNQIHFPIGSSIKVFTSHTKPWWTAQ